MRRVILKGGLSFLLAFFFLPAFARAESEAQTGLSADSYIRYMPGRKVEAQSGKVTLIAAESECAYEFKAFDKLPLKFSLGSQYIGIENSTAVELPAHLTGLYTGVEVTLPFFKLDKIYLRLGVYPSFYGDDWDFESSALRLPSRVLLIYRPEEKLTWVAGVVVCPDNQTLVWPAIGVIYQPNEKLLFELVPPRPNITYYLSQKIALFAEAGIIGREFEVDKDGYKNIILTYKETRLGSGVRYKINKYIQSSLSAGGVFNRRLQYRDSLGKVGIRSGFYTELSLKLSI